MPECLECGTSFAQKQGLRPMKYCGSACRNRYLKRVDYARPKATLVRRSCDVCEKEFQQTKRNQRYCSHECYTKGWPILNREKVVEQQKLRRVANPQWYAAREPGYRRVYRAKLFSKRPWHYLLKSRESDAKRKSVPFALTDEWASARWTGRCEITGIEFRSHGKPGPHPFSPSIDQIEVGKGYVPGNARFVLFGVNTLKGSGTDADMLEIACAIVNNAHKN